MRIILLIICAGRIFHILHVIFNNIFLMATKRKASHPTNVDGRPVKKSKSTTAGRGAEGENSATANGRTDNSQNVSHNRTLNKFVFSDLLL